VALPLLSFPATAQLSEIPTSASASIVTLDFVPAQTVPNFDEVLVPLHAAQAAKAEKDRLDKIEADRVAEVARLAEEEAKAAAAIVARASVRIQPSQAVTFSSTSGGSLTGSRGYASPYGNCVLEPGINNPGFGNPITWLVLTQSPQIGSTALFWFNHTAVVTGFWSNGDIEVRHQNVSGGQTRYPRSAFRGFR
jgi:hypothetical protein